MLRLPLLICFFLLYCLTVSAQSPHTTSLTLDCSACHNPVNWNVDPTNMEFDHSSTGFKLIGQHVKADCKSCHSTLVFNEAVSECISCHQDIHQNSTGMDCSKCHNSDSWMVKEINQIHELSRFLLVGAHNKADCVQCHNNYPNLYFEPLSINCVSCHIDNFNAAASPNHIEAGFSTDCQDCHSINSNNWSADNFKHDFFPLMGGHKIADCFSCHEQGGNFTGLSSECFFCHQEDYEAVSDPNHLTGNFPTNCILCHTINNWSPASLDHNATQFPLTGVHLDTDCSSCHSQTFSGTPTVCVECHQDDFNTALNPNHTALSIPTDCQTCHTPSANWEPSLFPIHNNYFELIGAHSSIANNCITCHSGNYVSTPNTCIGCHLEDYNNTTNPSHSTANFSPDCLTCHSQNVWRPSTFEHDNQYFPIYSGEHLGEWNLCTDCHTNPSNFTVFSCIDCHDHRKERMDDKHRGISGYIYESQACLACHPRGDKDNAFNHSLTDFVLTGAHTTLDCAQCHSSGYAGTSSNCYDCHQANYSAAANPNHSSIAISTNCSDCHTTEPGWKPALFPQHNQFFELLGRHLEIANDCSSCHSGNYQTTSSECAGCHLDNFNASLNPNHSAAGIPVDCQNCHSSSGWVPSTFNHLSTGFELVGEHSAIQCSSCHQGTTTGLTQECVFCHLDNYNTAPNHTAQSFPTNCKMCHNSISWTQVDFNHQATNFPLTGTHLNINCSSCHEQGFTGTPQDCFACHSDSYNNAVNPNHLAAGIPNDCQSCHNTTAWIPSTFNHSSTGFSLLGQHITIQCSSCHEGTITGLNQECISCHLGNYNTAPNHTAQSFPTNCEMCHNSIAWTQVDFNHQATNFPLTGGHINVNCSSCHNGGFTGTTTVCSECHQPDYNSTTNPNHGALAIPTNCESCHTSNPNWQPALFPIHNNYFLIVGAHIAISNNCITCHNGDYNNTPNTCFGCHQSDYNATIDPPHQSANFSTDCELCHTQSYWEPSTFDHDNQYFPIYRGKHKDEWNTCADCHIEPTNYSIFSCIHCHKHRQSEMDIKHANVPGYVYNSLACLSCHPDGENRTGLRRLDRIEK